MVCVELRRPVSPAWRRWTTFFLLSLTAFVPAPQAGAAEQPKPADSRPLTLADCVAIALQNQPVIQAQQAALAAAAEQQKVARSYFFPQVDLSSRYIVLDKPLSEELPSPFAGPLADVLSDSAAFFGIARQAGSAAALAALNNPSLPPFSTGKQQFLSALPSTFKVDVFGDTLFANQVLLTQPVYTGGRIRYHNQQAKLGVQAAGVDVAQAKLQIAYQVRRAYYGILLGRQLVRVVDNATGQFRAVEKLAQSLLAEGDEFVTTTDVNRIRALRLSAESQKIEFQHAVDLAHAGLRAAMGLSPLEPLTIADVRLEVKPVTLELPDLLAVAAARRPEVIKAGIGVDNAGLKIKLAEAEYCPTVGLYSSVNTLDGRRTFPNPHDPLIMAAGVSAEWKLFAGGRRNAERRKAQYELLQAKHLQQAALTLVGLEVEKAYLEYREASKQLPVAEKARGDAQATLKGFHDQFAANLIADKDMPKYFENLLTTQLLLSLTEARYNQKLYLYNIALAKIRLVTASHE
jgi:outer membrane protein TolC